MHGIVARFPQRIKNVINSLGEHTGVLQYADPISMGGSLRNGQILNTDDLTNDPLRKQAELKDAGIRIFVEIQLRRVPDLSHIRPVLFQKRKIRIHLPTPS